MAKYNGNGGDRVSWENPGATLRKLDKDYNRVNDIFPPKTKTYLDADVDTFTVGVVHSAD